MPLRPMTRGLLAGLLLALAGCATFPPLAADPPGAWGDFEEWMAVAETHAAAGETDSAVAAFRAAASDAPARKEPWLRIARLRAANEEPALAMIAAGEVLRRDPGDLSASDIYVASGLRIAVDTLQRLRASDPDRHARHQAQAQAVADLLTQIYAADDVLPAPVAQALADRAVEQWKREHPTQAAKAERPASPLDILGGD